MVPRPAPGKKGTLCLDASPFTATTEGGANIFFRDPVIPHSLGTAQGDLVVFRPAVDRRQPGRLRVTDLLCTTAWAQYGHHWAACWPEAERTPPPPPPTPWWEAVRYGNIE
eukprot:16441543-Heterocapsa_arctica.AAC.1